MRKIYITALLGALLMVSCKKAGPEEPARPQAVDLGLSVMWADKNVGAADPSGSGAFFSWGEVESKKDYSWDTYKWCDGTNVSINKYCADVKYGHVDGKTVLETADDVAAAVIGEGWRLPTPAEWQELIDNCNWAAETIGDQPGLRISAKDGSGSIFLPIAGGYEGENYFGSGSRGLYWARTLSSESSACAEFLTCYTAGSSIARGIAYCSRSYGLPVRAVRSR